MGDTPRRGHQATQSGCIFCGGSAVTQGLLWPGWALRAAKVKNAEASPAPACKKCRTEWMDALEAEAQPAATRLIQGEAVTLNPDMQAALARWIMLKVMASEQDQTGGPVIPQHDRSAFRLKRTIPPYVTIWVTRCGSPKWRNASAKPSAVLCAPDVTPPTDGQKNGLTVAFGLGALFAYAVLSRAETVSLNDFIILEDPMMRLWPLPGMDLTWPAHPAIDDTGADAIARALETLVSHPNVHLRAIA
jgi:hypothetical protein